MGIGVRSEEIRSFWRAPWWGRAEREPPPRRPVVAISIGCVLLLLGSWRGKNPATSGGGRLTGRTWHSSWCADWSYSTATSYFLWTLRGSSNYRAAWRLSWDCWCCGDLTSWSHSCSFRPWGEWHFGSCWSHAQLSFRAHIYCRFFLERKLRAFCSS